jgi:predicted PurR-regulated permease PerM
MIIYLGRNVLLGLFLAIIISSGLEFLVNFLEKKGLPRTLGVVAIFMLAALAVILLIYAVVPVIIVDLTSIFSTVSNDFGDSFLGSLVNLKTVESFGEILNRLSAQFFAGNLSPIGTLSNILGGLGLAIAVIVSSFYLSLSRDGVERFIKAVFPDAYEEAALRIYTKTSRKIGLWFRAQIILSLIVGISMWIGLAILGVRHSFVLGILAAIFELVPFVGPILSGAMAVIVAFHISFTKAIYVLIFSLLLHQLESHVLVPILAKRSVDVHPVIVIIALLIGAEILGVLGLLIAVPAAVVFQEIIEDWSRNNKKARTAII